MQGVAMVAAAAGWWGGREQTDSSEGLTSVFLRLLVPHASLKSSSASCCYCRCMPITEGDGDSQEVHALARL